MSAFQIFGNGISPNDDSKGSQFRSEEMIIDPNIFRNLKMGQAVVYLKDQNKVEVVNTWHGKKALNKLIKKPNTPNSPPPTQIIKSRLL